MKPRRGALDVGHLPATAFGTRAPLWWGVFFMVAIEGTMFVLVALSYFYLRQNETMWPPTPAGRAATLYSGLGALSLLVSVVPMWLCSRAAFRGDLQRIRLWLLIGTLLGFAFLACRVLEIRALPFRWDSHAYGSLVWLVIGLHTFHGIASVGENVLLFVFLFIGPVEEKHHVDLDVNSLYWYFVVAVWTAFYPLLYLEKVIWR